MAKVKGCVLVVDDSVHMRQALREVLIFEDYCPVTAANGKEALDQLQQVLPNLIVTDLMMPVLDGISFMEALAQNDLFDQVPVILMTESDIQSTKIRLQNSGLSCHVVQKPLNLRDFMVLVEEGVARTQAFVSPRPPQSRIDPLPAVVATSGTPSAGRKRRSGEGRKLR